MTRLRCEESIREGCRSTVEMVVVLVEKGGTRGEPSEPAGERLLRQRESVLRDAYSSGATPLVRRDTLAALKPV